MLPLCLMSDDRFSSGTSLDMKEKNAEALKEKAEGKKDENASKRQKIAAKGGDKGKVTGKGKAGVVKGTKGGTVDDLNLTKQEKEAYDDLDKEEQEIFVIKKKVERNHYLDKKDQFEVSREDEVKAGLVPA
jgi:hypothetical protein